MYFNLPQISTANMAFGRAEELAARYFHLSFNELRKHRYDVKTLAHLEKHEVKGEVFAHLCRYRYKKDKDSDWLSEFNFYRVCLQDNRILDAVDRAGSFIKFSSLMLYIATHELVHVIRFDRENIDFDASQEDKSLEEEKVHAITRDMLRSLVLPDLGVVLDCFSDRYQLLN
ncbi:MAG: hypothetical protein HY742_06820 [Deltaproteobacteria bacterium]|nr:hypothetical protein [Deltaproteobacteria bacterium]